MSDIHNQGLMCPLDSLAPSQKREDWMTIGSATEAPTITQSKTLNEQPTRRQTTHECCSCESTA